MFASADCDSHKQPLPKFLPSTHVIISKETKFDIQSALVLRSASLFQYTQLKFVSSANTYRLIQKKFATPTLTPTNENAFVPHIFFSVIVILFYPLLME